MFARIFRVIRDFGQSTSDFRCLVQHLLIIGSTAPQGPAAVLLQVFDQLGGRSLCPAVLRSGSGGAFDFWIVDQSILVIMLKQDLWLALCRQVAERRKHIEYMKPRGSMC